MNRQTRTVSIIDRTQGDWYKDAIIYQVHVKAYQDSNGDGIGDFAGLIQRLDHVQELGATAVWLMPFYPSPLRDDGYDISEYRAINPSYGTMADFRKFVTEAHRRGLRVITELVINHTSDQHPWFQKARHAKKGSAARNFYVWSDDDQKWMDTTRIIFTDTETSNWTWDPVAEQFYWHRFYSHQPDLNFDNPQVLREVLRVMRFWLDMGVDGLRLDAIPYLVEREGTNNENLPETHEVLKKIRADLDAHYPDRMLLAEANQWPEDTRPYFGDGDECHMAFHFPLMPRMYMAVAQEDRHPITDIIRQTPEIPDQCQWAIFLRNHDELTLEMVTDNERDYLWNTYAADRQARINMGIRRRLAPLMQNDRRKIELMKSMLLSMPGTPILYYGDEIGMGDNYYLGDRDGVRTPMQWSSDRNAGFSRAVPQRLYLPIIQDPLYGYEAVNVEAQHGDPSSLLNWMKRMVAVRQKHKVFGRGEMTLLYPSNRKVLAYMRRYEGKTVVCIANLSRSAQAAEIDLSDFKGRVPIELTGQSPFPPIGDLPYLMTLPAFGFYWFYLADETEAPNWHLPTTQILPEFTTLTTRDGRLATALSGREGQQLQRDVLPKFLPLQRWFASKDRAIRSVGLKQLAELDRDHVLAALDVEIEGGRHRYFLPLATRWGEENLGLGTPTLSHTLSRIRQGPHVGAVIDGTADAGLAEILLTLLREDAVHETPDGAVIFRGSDRLRAIQTPGTPRLMAVEQSNASIRFSDQIILKFYRRLRSGPQPEIEMARFLTEVARFDNTPALLGAVDCQRGDETLSLAAAFAFVQNQGDAWTSLTGALARDLQDHAIAADTAKTAVDPPHFSPPLDMGALLGRRTAELHRALATPTDDPAFAAEPINQADVTAWVDEAQRDLASVMGDLQHVLGDLPEAAQPQARDLLARQEALRLRIEAIRGMSPSGAKTRIHGDYHLGQILIVQNDLMIIDFEGEPRRTIKERRAKSAPLRDVAGMLRSLDYAAWSALDHEAGFGGDTARIRTRIEDWRKMAVAQFRMAYDAAIAGSSTHPEPDFARALLDLFLIQKAAYELAYELSSRPAWVTIPLRSLCAMLDEEDSGDE